MSLAMYYDDHDAPRSLQHAPGRPIDQDAGSPFASLARVGVAPLGTPLAGCFNEPKSVSRRSSRVKIERHEGSRKGEPGKNGCVVFGVKVPRRECSVDDGRLRKAPSSLYMCSARMMHEICHSLLASTAEWESSPGHVRVRVLYVLYSNERVP
ncbi:hypothetical protein V8C35DRAFT_163012 [Trichoderma chlorosporum]